MKMFAPHATDFYKTGHAPQYVEGTQYVYANFTSRGDKHATFLDDFDHKVMWVGISGTLQELTELWNESFFLLPEKMVIDKFTRRMNRALGPGKVNPAQMSALHKLGYLPISVKALPEGSRVNLRVPMYTIINENPDFYWVTNYLETYLSAETWPTMTSATTAFEYRRLLEKWAKITGTPREFVKFQGHDFSMRGMMGTHAAVKSGIGHLASFTGTDTIPAIDYIEDYYKFSDSTLIGASVPATEHSVMCMGGLESEIETFRRLITKVYPDGIVSIVSDTWDFWKVITEFTVTLKDEIMVREGKVVFRPDSGNPVKIIVGDPEAPWGSPAFKGAVQCLWDVFGGTTNSQGYKTLDSHVGLIYGDSITLPIALAILEGLAAKGFSSGNIVLGIGSFTYQFVTRDNFGTAIKATWGVVDGVARELAKDPKTDSGLKKSAKGLLRVEREGDNWVLYDQQTPEQEKAGELKLIYENGKLIRKEDWETIQDRVEYALVALGVVDNVKSEPDATTGSVAASEQ